ncbi:hypothetical protein ACY2L5_004294 [Providencia rettgeri]
MIKLILKREALLLALLTSCAYIVAYLYELGYADSLNYPDEFISINLENLFYAGLSILIFVTISLVIISIIVGITSKLGIIGKAINTAFICSYLLFFISFISYLIGHKKAHIYLYTTLVFFISFSVITFVTDWISKRKIDGLIKNNEAHITKEDVAKIKEHIKELSISLKGYENFTKNQRVVIYSLIFMTMGSIAITLGNYHANIRSSFYYFENDGHKYVIIKNYNGIVISKKLDNEKIIKDESFIFTQDSLDKKVFKHIKIINSHNALSE